MSKVGILQKYAIIKVKLKVERLCDSAEKKIFDLEENAGGSGMKNILKNAVVNWMK